MLDEETKRLLEENKVKSTTLKKTGAQDFIWAYSDTVSAGTSVSKHAAAATINVKDVTSPVPGGGKTTTIQNLIICK